MAATNSAGAGDPFQINADTYTVPASGDLVFGPPGVLANDFGAGLTVDPYYTLNVQNLAQHGVVVIEPNGAFLYAKDPTYTGSTDSFAYQATSNSQGYNYGTATVTLNFGTSPPPPPPPPPSPPPLQYAIAKATTLTVPAPGLEANTPGDTPQLVAGAGHGSLTLGSANNAFLTPGSFSYTPNAAFTGLDSFTFQNTSNGQNIGSPQTANITVTPPTASAPVANNDVFQEAAAATAIPLTVDAGRGVLVNDVDPFGKTLTVHLAGPASLGTVNLAADGSFTYTPRTAGALVDHFTYYDTNGSSQSPLQTAWIVVGNATGSTVQAVNHSYSVPANQPTDLSVGQGVLNGDKGPTGAALASFVTSVPQHGTVSLAPDGSFEYIPTGGYVGQDHFGYLAADGSGAVGLAGVTITVDPHATTATMLG